MKSTKGGNPNTKYRETPKAQKGRGELQPSAAGKDHQRAPPASLRWLGLKRQPSTQKGKEMKKTNAKLAVVQQGTRTAEEKQLWRDNYDKWQKVFESWCLHSGEVRGKVAALRTELESYREQLEAVPFDIPSGEVGVPHSLDRTARKYILELLDDFNPLPEKFMNAIDEYAEENGCHQHLDFQSKLFEMRMYTAETGFQMGILAGVIFAGCSKDTVDKFTRGLELAFKSSQCVR